MREKKILKMQQDKPKRGRPVKYPMPAPIPDTPENIIKAILATPPKEPHEWKFVQEREQKETS